MLRSVASFDVAASDKMCERRGLRKNTINHRVPAHKIFVYEIFAHRSFDFERTVQACN